MSNSVLLQTPIEYLKGVGPQRAAMLKAELSIFTFQDLLHYFPFRHIDKTQIVPIGSIEEDSRAVLMKGILRSLNAVGEGRKRRLTGVLRDETGAMDLVWFQGVNWLEKSLEVGKEYLVYGKPTLFNGRPSLTHPDMSPVNQEKESTSLYMEPVYPITEILRNRKVDSRAIMQMQKSLFQILHPRRQEIPETLPDYLIKKLNLDGRYESLLTFHFPKNNEVLENARKRLKFEELFLMQTRLLYGKTLRKEGTKGYVFDKVGDFFNKFYKENLKFPLTGAQMRVVKEIRKDIGSGKQMNRLLQGDVGSGKTVVALMVMLIAIDNGFQATMMAPTEILAQQHFQSLSEMVEGTGVKVALLTGSTGARDRKKIVEQLVAGEIHIAVGTHALIEDWVQFKHLGLCITDEQHRFGVAQRARLWAKSGDLPPHILVMTATPIPRTLAMTLYGDLDVSVIDEMPPGRIPIKTLHHYETHRLRVFGFMKEQIAEGRQVYIVFPMIEESETQEEIKNLMEGYEAICRDFPQPDYQVSIVHGKMKAKDKDFEMQRFIKRETQIMIATTVIEVGVNVPNATVMIIENADRFGLSQLHQLRGRVGRGGGASYCILMTGFKVSPDGKERIKTMCQTTDGFEIAEADLRLRGPGNLEGTQQSGLLQFRIADLAKDGRILQIARDTIIEILEKDPHLEMPENLPIKQYLHQSTHRGDWGKIS